MSSCLQLCRIPIDHSMYVSGTSYTSFASIPVISVVLSGYRCPAQMCPAARTQWTTPLRMSIYLPIFQWNGLKPKNYTICITQYPRKTIMWSIFWLNVDPVCLMSAWNSLIRLWCSRMHYIFQDTLFK